MEAEGAFLGGLRVCRASSSVRRSPQSPGCEALQRGDVVGGYSQASGLLPPPLTSMSLLVAKARGSNSNPSFFSSAAFETIHLTFPWKLTLCSWVQGSSVSQPLSWLSLTDLPRTHSFCTSRLLPTSCHRPIHISGCSGFLTARVSVFPSEKVKVKLLSRVRLFVTPWTIAYQAPLSMGLSRQEYWSGLPFPPPGDLPDPGIEPRSPVLQADALTSRLRGSH